MQEAARRHGWQLVTGISSRFTTHGYCAIDGWLVRLQDSFAIQGDHYGGVHPNAAGHAAYAEAIAAAVGR
jgi:lysophospholipase L1-like esterase